MPGAGGIGGMYEPDQARPLLLTWGEQAGSNFRRTAYTAVLLFFGLPK